MTSVNKENVPRQQEKNKNFFFKRHLRIISKLGKLHIIQQAAGCFDDVFTLLWGLLDFSRQEKTASTRHLLRHESHHQSRTISPLPGLGRKKNDHQLNLRIWGTAWRSETCRSGGNIWCQLPGCHSVWWQSRKPFTVICKSGSSADM